MIKVKSKYSGLVFIRIKPGYIQQILLSLALVAFIFFSLIQADIAPLIITIITILSFSVIFYFYLAFNSNHYLFGPKKFYKVNIFIPFKRRRFIKYKDIICCNITKSVKALQYSFVLYTQQKSELRRFFNQQKVFSICIDSEFEKQELIKYLVDCGVEFDEYV